MYPDVVKNLIYCLKKLPGIGEKSAERIAFSIVNFDDELLTSFSNALLDVRDKIGVCKVCNNIADSEMCKICSSDTRNKNIVFVVEKSKDIVLFEKIGVYKGVYHVLGGLISPLDGVGPEDINLKSLVSRIDNGNIDEVILALKPSVEGETTTQYIKRILDDKNVKITKIATGIPIGTDMEYIDSLTLEMSLEERKIIS